MTAHEGRRVAHEFDGAGRMRFGGGGWTVSHANLLTAREAGTVSVEFGGFDPFRYRVADLIREYEIREAA